jgi:DNA-binding CsgD family transcriptional regulator
VAAFRSGKTERAADALHRLSAMTHASGTDWALAIEARSRARLSDGDAAERLYLEAIGRLGRTRIRVELLAPISSVANGCAASAGGWMPASSCVLPTRCLRGSVPRPSPIAPHLSCWLPRGAPRKRTVGTPEDLTPQEVQIARLAREELSEPEMGARLFISPYTVEYHLHKVLVVRPGSTVERGSLRPCGTSVAVP